MIQISVSINHVNSGALFGVASEVWLQPTQPGAPAQTRRENNSHHTQTSQDYFIAVPPSHK